MKLDNQLNDLLDYTKHFGREKGFEFITPELVLFCSIDYPEPAAIFEVCNVNEAGLRKDLLEYLGKNFPPKSVDYSLSAASPEHSYALNEVLDFAVAQSLNAEKTVVSVGQFLVALYDNENLYGSYILKKNGLERVELLSAISEFEADVDSAPEQDADFEPMSFVSEPPEKDSPEKILDNYAQNLTAMAKEGKLDTLIGREDVLDRTIDVLCRRTKNNPIHVGDSGVGKTSITEGLAQRIVSGNVPDFLKGFEIYSVEMGSLIAGTKFRGEFEKRLKSIVSAMTKKKKAILFIDEIHTLVGAGSGGSGSLDAANILKPALSKGNLRCIGSTTFEEYAKHFEKDRALARRFQKIDVLEPDREDCIKILRGIAPKYEDFHKVKYSADSITSAVDLSVQFFTERRLPDKAIDVLDEAGVYVRLHKNHGAGTKTPSVTVNDVRRVVAKTARIPLENITLKEKEKLRDIESNLNKEIFGQQDAVHAVSVAVKKARAGFRDIEKPEASFLFVGPTGVGKTELAKVLAQTLGVKLLRFDMSEYQESYTISRLIGSAPGYVGYENGGVLTDAVRKDPHAVILFDEIEKAHEDIYNTLLQVLDYGTLTDTQGRKADFRNCMIIFTSNAGARDMGKSSVGFDSGDKIGANDRFILKDAVEKVFTPEFRNRLDSIIYFGHLSKEVSLSIAKKAVSKIAQRLVAKSVRLEVSDSVLEYIAENGCSSEFGARNIMRFAEEKIASPLVDEVLFGRLSGGGVIRADMKDGAVIWNQN